MDWKTHQWIGELVAKDLNLSNEETELLREASVDPDINPDKIGVKLQRVL